MGLLMVLWGESGYTRARAGELVEYYKIPDLARLLAGKSSFNLVAGVRLEALQKKILALPEPFAMGKERCLPVAA